MSVVVKFIPLTILLTTVFSAIDVKLNQPVLVNIKGQSNNSVTLGNVSADISYVTCQVHSQIKNVTLSSTPTPRVGKSLTGVDIGIVSVLQPTQTGVTWYLLSNHSEDVQVLLAVFLMSKNEPLVGGCNLEFSLEVDANLHVSYTTTKNLVEFQWSNIPLRNRSAQPDCEDRSFQDMLEYNIYVKYLSENDFTTGEYFSTLKQMMTAEDVLANGVLLAKTKNKATVQKPEFLASSYTGTGAVYNMIVKATTPSGVTMAAYFPKVTYSCNLQQRDGCKMYGVFWMITAVLLGIAGVFLTFLGHRLFRTGNFFCAFLGFCIIFYSVQCLYSSQSDTVVLVVMVILSVVCAVFWVGMYELVGAPALSVLFSGLVAGYIISSIVFYTKFGNLSYWDSSFNYGMAFTCGVLAIPVFILAYTKVLNILSCAFIGSYLIILVPDIFLHTGMKYIVVNSIRHSTDFDYINVINTGPFLLPEIILSCAWFLFCVFGAFVQFYRDWNKPDFPQSSRRCGKKVQPEYNQVPARYNVDSEGDSDREPDERSPLLRQTRNIRHHRERVLAAPT
ncbi:transmembrane 7 superfamily member 3-like [Saccostrea echinata]|uniref:transmembrane 7 superfamily member 3-like n=1 Tax=Saccostrea echinata TaxID=191078 RepID=UPI002A82DB5D|nr:transmembrane 7 superfamily member 3-like [Saccostrea echinata]